MSAIGMMRFTVLRWALLPGIAVHNFEEWLSLPHFRGSNDAFYARLNSQPWAVVEIGLILATVVPSALIVWVSTGAAGSYKTWAICWLASVFCINVFAPHVVASIMTFGYTPGVASAVLVLLPVCLLLLRQALLENLISSRQLWAVVVVGAVSLPLSIFLTFQIARFLVGVVSWGN